MAEARPPEALPEAAEAAEVAADWAELAAEAPELERPAMADEALEEAEAGRSSGQVRWLSSGLGSYLQITLDALCEAAAIADET